jgi:hypothetical protein
MDEPAPAAIPCVIYAAKSTEDRRGSIPDQLEQCRRVISGDARRGVVAEYVDEAVSGYRRDRGPGLRDAIEHCEDLASEHGLAELWAEHSDRLARGDGRSARHTVEIALWALKNDVRVRTLQDPDTFRDLLYAVVTGQRNNEDSKRKAVSTQAGLRRAVARGQFVGVVPDGYTLVRTLGQDGVVKRRLVLDPDRQPLIELIFRLALRKRNAGQIARAITERGWLTKPTRRIDSPHPFGISTVIRLIRNPAYAGLAVREGEILARNCWPHYITERQHRLIRSRSKPTGRPAPHTAADAFLLKGLATCGRCGASLHSSCGPPRQDGRRHRTYVCHSGVEHRGKARCHAPCMDAHIAEAMLIASLPVLLAEGGDTAADFRVPASYSELGADIAQRQRVTRERADVARLQDWIQRESAGRTDQTRSEVAQLARVIDSWFATLSIEVGEREVVIVGRRRRAYGDADSVVVCLDRTRWTRAAPPGRRQLSPASGWAQAEIVGAIQSWIDERGMLPRYSDWHKGSGSHPVNCTVTRAFGTWSSALAAAGFEPPPGQPRPWREPAILAAMRAWAREHGRPPTSSEWAHASPSHPTSATVRRRFGVFENALASAGLSAPHRRWRFKPWTDEQILEALRSWAAVRGRAPTSFDWLRAGPGRPSATTVRYRYGSWSLAIQEAGLERWLPRNCRRWDRELMIEALRDWAAEHGRRPVPKDFAKATERYPSLETFYNRFGSWPTALRAAGLPTARP